MNTELFLAKKFSFSKKSKSGYSGSIIKVAIIGIALGIAVMILSVAILSGFKSEVRDKVSGFSAHYSILNYDENNSFESKPISRNLECINKIKKIKGVDKINAFATKGGIVKSDQNIEGVLFKGVDKNYDWSFFSKHLVKGKEIHFTDSSASNDIIISETLAKKLKLDTGSYLAAYFIQQPPRMRKFKVSGIYKTSFEEFDKLFIYNDLKHIQKINSWDSTQVSGIEIYLKNFDDIDLLEMDMLNAIGWEIKEDGSSLKIESIKEKYPQIFDWLKLQDINVWVILTLISIVCGINMITGLLILIIDRTQTIGVLKALGASNWFIRKVFLYQGIIIASKALILGNIIGLAIAIFQKQTGFFKLDASVYYMPYIPIEINLLHILLINIVSLILIYFMLILPTIVISKIQASKTINFA